MKKVLLSIILTVTLLVFGACGSSFDAVPLEKVTVDNEMAAIFNTDMDDILALYAYHHPEQTVGIQGYLLTYENGTLKKEEKININESIMLEEPFENGYLIVKRNEDNPEKYDMGIYNSGWMEGNGEGSNEVKIAFNWSEKQNPVVLNLPDTYDAIEKDTYYPIYVEIAGNNEGDDTMEIIKKAETA